MTRLLSELIPLAILALLFVGLWLVVHNLLPVVFHFAMSLVRGVTRFVFERGFKRRAASDTVVLWSAISITVLIGSLTTLAVADSFFDLAEALHANSPILQHVDNTVYEWAAYFRSSAATGVFSILTIIGTPVGLGVLVTGAAAVIIARGQRRLAAYLVLTSIGGSILNVLLKLHFARARPDLTEALRQASGYSFPSGHAMGSVIVFGALAYVSVRLLRRWRQQSAAVALALTLAFAISASRVYLGVHWISDIGAGAAAGGAWLATTTLGYELFRRLRALKMRRRRVTP